MVRGGISRQKSVKTVHRNESVIASLEVRWGLGPHEGTNQPNEPTQSATFHLCGVAAATNDRRISSSTMSFIASRSFRKASVVGELHDRFLSVNQLISRLVEVGTL